MTTLHLPTDSDVSLDLTLKEQEEGVERLPPPTFFYLMSGRNFIGIPIKEDALRTEILFPYKWELVKTKEGSYSQVKPFYPVPVIRLRDTAIEYDAPAISAAEKAYIVSMLTDRRRHLQRLLHAYGKDPEEYLEFLKRRRMRLENPVEV